MRSNRLANDCADTRRLKKERSARELGLGRTEETEVERFRETYAHRASQPQVPGVRNVFDENRQAVDKQRLRYSVHHGAEHGL